MIQIDAEAGGHALFDVLFEGTLPLLPTWDEQPEAFKALMRTRAVTVASAALHADTHASEVPDDVDDAPGHAPIPDNPDEDEDGCPNDADEDPDAA